MKSIRLIAAALAMFVICGTGIALAAQDSEPESGSTAAAELGDAPQGSPRPELASKRTATSQTFRLADGALETRIYETPINYRDAEGNWKPIGEGLEPASGPTRPDALVNGDNSFDVGLPARLGAAPVRMSVGDGWIAERLLGAETQLAKLSDEGTASYESSGGETRFDFNTLANGLKEEIELDNSSQPSTIRFLLTASSGLTPTLVDDGSVELRDLENRVVATLPAPVVSDAPPASTPVSGPVKFSLVAQGGDQWELSVELDKGWLQQPERRFPVRIDPSMTVPASLDCTIFSASPTANLCGLFGAPLASVYARYKSSGSDEYARSLYRFNLSSIPGNASISKATVRLHAPAAVKNTAGLEIRNIENAKEWTHAVGWRYYDGQTKWTTEGGDTGSVSASVSTASRGAQAGWWEFSSAPMAPLVSEWLTGAKKNNGFLVSLTDEKAHECCIERLAEFDSSAATEVVNRPYLAVEYYPPAPVTSKVVAPTEGTRTARRLKLRAAWEVAGVTGVTFQFREGKTGVFQTIPAELVRKASGEPITWPLAVSGVKESESLYFDAAHAGSKLQQEGGSLQVRAVFEGPSGVTGYSAPVEAVVNRFLGAPHDAKAEVGPGTLDLLTGNLLVGDADVSIPGFSSSLEFSRTFNSREAGSLGENSVLGQGWKPGVPVEQAGGAAWKNVRLVNFSETFEGETFSYAYAILTDLDGSEYAFEKLGESYVTPPEATGWHLTPEASGTRFVLTDPNGNRTTFENSGGGSEYLPVSISQTGAGNTTTMVYELVGGKLRLKMVIAPSPSGITCTEANITGKTGCHALTFSYLPATNWGAPAAYGDRLSKITYYAPGLGGPWEVANYSYDSSGRLLAEWDPRTSPALKETYSYESGGQIRTITPPGQEPWTMEYGTADGELANGRLMNVKRASLLASPSVAQTTIAYGVPVTGSGAPYDLSASAVAKWGQQDLPVDATAVFPPDEIPGSPPSSYSRASVYYMDAEGQLANTATPSGAGMSAPSITTTETDEFGNVVRELSPQNRLRALAAESGSVAKSHELETKRVYSKDGAELQEEWGPIHQVRLESGSLKQARLHTTLQYDEGWPGTGVKPHLPTRETTGASIVGEGIDADQRVTETHYNWNLRKPTETIVDPSGLNLRSVMVYSETTGLPVEFRQPSNSGGGGAGTTKISYYATGSGSETGCTQTPKWANLPCRVMPAAQPGTAGQPELLVRKFAYNQLGEPTEVTESPGGGAANVRKTITTYDAAGRSLTSRQEGGGTALPKLETLYSPSMGMPSSQRFVCEVNCSGFDSQATTTT